TPEKRISWQHREMPEHQVSRVMLSSLDQYWKDPVRNAAGLILYRVTFREGVADYYPAVNAPQDSFPDWHKPQVRNFVRAFTAQYGIAPVRITSWLSSGLSAYLSEEQRFLVANDSRVSEVLPAVKMKFSGVWSNSPPNYGVCHLVRHWIRFTQVIQLGRTDRV